MPNAKRIKNDFYPSESLITPILKRYVEIEGKTLEPFAGNGAISKHYPGIISNDLHDYGYPLQHRMNALRTPLYDAVKPRNVVTNPPYEHAEKALELALTYSSDVVAMLLRLSFLEPCKTRYRQLSDHDKYFSHLIILNPRPQFRTDTENSDQVTVCWFVWNKKHIGETQIIFAHGWK